MAFLSAQILKTDKTLIKSKAFFKNFIANLKKEKEAKRGSPPAKYVN